MGFKENLKDEIAYQGLLIKEVAVKAGLKPNTLSNYLRKNSSIPSADIAVKIAQALNVSVEYLVTGEELEQLQNAQQTKRYSGEIRQIADEIEKMNPKEKNLIKVIVKELSNNK